MTITVEAVYENGVLTPEKPLPLQERERVSLTIQSAVDLVRRTAGSFVRADPELIEKIAGDPELEYSGSEAP